MTLDLKAKAESIAGSFMPSSTGVDGWQRDRKELAVEIEGALKEVQSATRRETIKECARVAGEHGSGNSAYLWKACSGEIYEDILDLLTTPEKK